jgi:hypothetical protein
VSLHTIASVGFERLGHRRAAAAVARRGVNSTVAQPPMDLPGPFSGMSMRILETGLALTAIATAVLIGLGR